MIENTLWIALAFMIGSSIMPKKHRIRKLVGSSGWIFFSMHWFYQPWHYLEINDYFNVALVIAVGAICLIIAYTMAREYKYPELAESNSPIDVTAMATSATALGSLFYFPFAQMDVLNIWIISTVTENTFWVLQTLSYPAEMTAWNKIGMNGYQVEIILACTAIESIALFIGLISSVDAPLKRIAAAFMASVPVIYLLNIGRDVFVIIAYAQQWFGPNSFDIAHHTIAKIGSGIVLFVIAYIVMKILPELIDLIEGIWNIVAACIFKDCDKVVGNN